MTTRGTEQRTADQGKAPEHIHLRTTHSHDHYHVSHHHKDGVLGEWEHRTSWHTHEHNHTTLTHGHTYSQVREEAGHRKEAHLHDHAAPTGNAVRAFSDSEASLLAMQTSRQPQVVKAGEKPIADAGVGPPAWAPETGGPAFSMGPASLPTHEGKPVDAAARSSKKDSPPARSSNA
jgi:hypothetical protein